MKQGFIPKDKIGIVRLPSCSRRLGLEVWDHMGVIDHANVFRSHIPISIRREVSTGLADAVCSSLCRQWSTLSKSQKSVSFLCY